MGTLLLSLFSGPDFYYVAMDFGGHGLSSHYSPGVPYYHQNFVCEVRRVVAGEQEAVGVGVPGTHPPCLELGVALVWPQFHQQFLGDLGQLKRSPRRACSLQWPPELGSWVEGFPQPGTQDRGPARGTHPHLLLRVFSALNWSRFSLMGHSFGEYPLASTCPASCRELWGARVGTWFLPLHL